MTHERIKDLPATVPERARTPRDATIVLPPPSVGPGGATSIDSVAPIPLDSYQPPNSGTAALSAPPSQREVIVPSAATVGSVLEHVRKAPAERLEVEARLASGGMGSIDVAIDHALDRRIAIKTLHPHLRSDDQTVRMFLREARLTGLLDHPHIVPVYDLGERASGQLFFAMKLVEGQTLAALIRALPRGVLETATLYTLLDVFAKVCDALAFAHSRGVLHCDVKPANVMVGEFGQVFLMDWGIARLVAADVAPASRVSSGGAGANAAPRAARAPSLTDNSVIGTPGYMSPEQARGDRKKLDVRSDVFLLGALLYEILTHRPPYVSSDRSETLALAAAGTFPSPRKVAGDVAVPLELERIVLRAMAKAPEQRYASVAALKEDVVRFMRGGAEFPRRSFQPGEAIVREGEPGDAAYIIVEGRCEVRKQTPSGTQTLQTIEPGAVFGEMAILTGGSRTATVVAVEATTVLVITSHVLEHEMAALKPWMATLLKSLASRFRDVDTHNRATPAATLSPARIANQIFMMLATWGAVDERGGRWMKWSALAPELEAQLGLAPVALFGAVARYGLVLDVEADRLTVPDPEALRGRLERELADKPVV
ncbi:MAG: cyclic nucleotide-binding domain-containing protein [Labilithrix sp.]|nr:cyclic nucleotide-binding domain-containing protein [Labilithrix sp.]